MGGFTGGPPSPGDQGTPPVPASDPVLETFLASDDGKRLKDLFDLASGTVTGGLKLDALLAKKDLNVLATVLKTILDFIVSIEKDLAVGAQPVLSAIVQAVTALLIPVAGTMGGLTSAYVEMIAGGIGTDSGKDSHQAGAQAGIAGQYAFDKIVAPLSKITSGHDPSEPGAGAKNIQESLGAIVSTHLVTWVINIVSNLTGVGTLKFINSFNEAILSALNARGLSRVAMKPYLQTFMVDPATSELNSQFVPVNLPAGATLKAWVRGSLTTEQAQAMLRRLGFSEELQAQFLADAAKYLSDNDVGTLVNLGWWTAEQAIQYLQQQGWPAELAPSLLTFERERRVRTIQGDIAARAEVLLLQGKIDEDAFTSLLHDLEFSDLEIEALSIKASVGQAAKPHFGLPELQALYEANLVDLDFILDRLEKLGWSSEDANLIVLLRFTDKKERDARRAMLAARSRVLSARLKIEAQIALNKSESDVSAAEQALAAKEAALAASLGG